LLQAYAGAEDRRGQQAECSGGALHGFCATEALVLARRRRSEMTDSVAASAKAPSALSLGAFGKKLT
jgi:hypothetical protein